MALRVLHIVTEHGWRGGENQLYLLVHHLSKPSGFDVEHHVVAQPGSALLSRLKDVAGLHAVRMRNDLDLLAAHQIGRLVQRLNIDVIHCQSARAHSLGLLAKKMLGLGPKVKKTAKLIVHRRVEHRPKLGLFDRIKYLSPMVDLYIGVSNAIASGLVKSGVAESKVHMIHSAVSDAQTFGAAADRTRVRKEFFYQSTDTVVCCVAAMEPNKGIPYLLQAWQRLFDSGIVAKYHLKLLLVGSGPLAHGEQLGRWIFGDAASSVHIAGFRTDVSSILAASDVMVLPTLWEGLGTVLLDGLLAGCALIASDVGGVPEIIEHEKTGLLVPPADPGALTAAIEKLAADPFRRQQLVAAGVAHIRKEFSLDNLIQKTFQLYKI